MYINVHKRFLKFFYASLLKNLPGIRIHEKHVEKVRSLHSIQRRLFKRTKIFLVTRSTCSQENAVLRVYTSEFISIVLEQQARQWKSWNIRRVRNNGTRISPTTSTKYKGRSDSSFAYQRDSHLLHTFQHAMKK